MIEQEIISSAVETFNWDDNIDKFLEEIAEAQFALLKLKREFIRKNTDKRLEQVRQELADVKMSLNVVIDLFGKNEVEAYYKKNLNKLKNKLN